MNTSPHVAPSQKNFTGGVTQPEVDFWEPIEAAEGPRDGAGVNICLSLKEGARRKRQAHCSDPGADRCTARAGANVVTELGSQLHSGSSPQWLPDPLFREGSQVKAVKYTALSQLPGVNKGRCKYLRDTCVGNLSMKQQQKEELVLKICICSYYKSMLASFKRS